MGLLRYQLFFWERGQPKPFRALSSIVLDHQQKRRLIDDLDRFLDPEARKKYYRQGIPYRRGYLLAGPPGSGKSSLSLALAGFTKLDIYTILFSEKLDDNGLNTLFQALPERCIVLLEDFDVSGLQISRNAEPGSDRIGKSNLSLSCLLNVLDGVNAPEGRILILSTNHAENLDPALIRPGRIDTTISFGYATPQSAQELFLTFYMEIPKDEIFIGQPDENNIIRPVTQPTLPNWEPDDIIALSCLFAKYYRLIECTTSDLQLYLQAFWSCPAAAVTNLFEDSCVSHIDLRTQLATLGTSKSLISIGKNPYMARITLYIQSPSGEFFLEQLPCTERPNEGGADGSWKPPQGRVEVQDQTLEAAVKREVLRLTSLHCMNMQMPRYHIHENTQLKDLELGWVDFTVLVHVSGRQNNNCETFPEAKGAAEFWWVSARGIQHIQMDPTVRETLSSMQDSLP
ncbi:P-loop containing nucleoside triphosphate hydrolase protein [Aspergillus recurvatus]